MLTIIPLKVPTIIYLIKCHLYKKFPLNKGNWIATKISVHFVKSGESFNQFFRGIYIYIYIYI